MIDKFNYITNMIGNFNMYIYVPSGSAYENDGIRGISHFLEHLLMKHTKNYTNIKLYKEITKIGGLSNAGTSKDVTYYFIKTHVDNYKITIKLMYDIIHSPIFTQEEFEKERKVILEEFMQRGDSVDTKLDDLSNAAILAPNNPFVYPIRGDIDDIMKMTLKDIRAFYKKYYSKFIAVVNCDKLHMREVKIYMESIFGKNTKVNLQNDLIKNYDKVLEEGRVIIQRNDVYAQYSTVLSFITYPISEIKSIAIMNFIKFFLTSSGFNSLLFTKIREQRGLVYSIFSSHEEYRLLGVYKIGFSSTNGNIQYITSLIISCLYQLKKKGLSDKQLKYFKQSYINRFKYFLTDSSMKELWYGNCLFYQVNLNEKIYLKMIQNIKNEEIIKTCREVFNFSSMGIASIGKYKDISFIERDLREIKKTYDIV